MTVTNPELQIANDFVQHTNCNIFLTGKAGTGKTTFLHNLKKNIHKRMIVTAPTGVAAINAGGVTLHSFFQMPFGPFVPGSEAYDRNNQRKFNKEKINIIKSLDLLIIDEISMVRADLLDGVDAVLRRYRRGNLPFGGVQLLMIGDLHQLSPVAKDDEWSILRQYYDSVYFFSSNALSRTELVSIELKHIYRQSDIRFIELLNRVRDNKLDPPTLQKLNKRYIPDFAPADNEGYITLSTHNRGADTVNESKLRALGNKLHHFKAEIEGDFPEHTFPASAILNLKVGAQVMFVRNDTSGEKQYFNGKIGKITRITGKNIWVKCPADNKEIEVEQAAWENIKYKIDSATKEITESKIGKFVQYPLKTAWAITIHKSQGLTFEKAVIDARDAFAPGQVYVALSRCKTFEGMVLSSPISSRAVKTDETVSRFVQNASQNPPTQEKLEAAKISYQQLLLKDCFDFQGLRFRLNRLVTVLMNNARVVQVSGVDEIRELRSIAEEEVFVVSEKFQRQLNRLFENNVLPESDAAVLERITKASVYFQEKIEAVLGTFIRDIRIDTDNKEIGKKAKEALNLLKKETTVKLAAVKSCRTGFSPAHYLRAISAAEIDFKPVKKEKHQAAVYTESDVKHPELFQSLKEWRSDKAAEEEVAHYRILHQRVLIQIAVTLPDNLADLKKIKGIGKRTAEKYGAELVALVSAYRQKHHIVEVEPPEPKTVQENSEPEKEKPHVSDTKSISFDMFNTGLTIAQIAKERDLVNSTIEGHLTFFVEEGKLEIGKLLSTEKHQTIEQKLIEMEKNSLGEIKHALGGEYSYGEIKIVQAHLKYRKKKELRQHIATP